MPKNLNQATKLVAAAADDFELDLIEAAETHETVKITGANREALEALAAVVLGARKFRGSTFTMAENGDELLITIPTSRTKQDKYRDLGLTTTPAEDRVADESLVSSERVEQVQSVIESCQQKVDDRGKT